MKITRLETCEVMPVNMDGVKDASKQVPIGIADGTPNFSICVFTINPAAIHRTTATTANTSTIFWKGWRSAGGDQARPITSGDYILVKPQEKHQYRNTGAIPLKFMCMVPKEYE